MTQNPIEAAVMLSRFQRLKQQYKTELSQTWMTKDLSTGESYSLSSAETLLSETEQKALRALANTQSTLQIPQLLNIIDYEFDAAQSQLHIRSQTVAGSSSYNLEAAFTQQWLLLKQLIKLLQQVHGLGFSHGLITPDNLSVFQGELYLSNVGVAHWLIPRTSPFASPQMKAGDQATPSDDIYSLGQLIFSAFGKGYYQSSASLKQLNLPDDVLQLLTNMLSENSYERPTDFDFISETISQHLTEIASKLEKRDLSSEPAITIKPLLNSSPRDRFTISTVWVMFGIGVLIIAAVFVFFLLPQQTNSRPQDGENAATPTTRTLNVSNTTTVELAPLEAAKLAQLKQDGQQAANQLLKLQIQLEDKGGQVWAVDEYQLAVRTGLNGDQAYKNENFQQALNDYQSAISILKTSIASVDDVFDKNIAVGNQALLRGDAKQAIEAFTILQTIRPNSSEIKNSLSRAENLEAVQKLMADGAVQEREAEFKAALKSYHAVRELDSQWLDAETSIKRVKQVLAKLQFNHQMSLGFKAMNDADFDLAEKTFKTAQSLRPNSSAPADGLDQLLTAKNGLLIRSHRRKTETAMAAGQWLIAIKEFDSILALTAGSQFAVDGRALAESRLSLTAELANYISNPALLMADDQLKLAKRLLLRANRVAPKTPQLKNQLGRLSLDIALARIPVALHITSNNKTSVTIYKVAEFGFLQTHSLNLMPGTYTAVGKRKGYRDVSVNLALRGGQKNATVDISCEEKI